MAFCGSNIDDVLIGDSGSKGCPEQESAGCHFGTLGESWAKIKWPLDISKSNRAYDFQQMKLGTSVIPHVILTGQSNYGHDYKSFSRSKSQFQGQVRKNTIFTK